MPDSFLLVFVDLFLPTVPKTTEGEVTSSLLHGDPRGVSTCGWEPTG